MPSFSAIARRILPSALHPEDHRGANRKGKQPATVTVDVAEQNPTECNQPLRVPFSSLPREIKGQIFADAIKVDSLHTLTTSFRQVIAEMPDEIPVAERSTIATRATMTTILAQASPDERQHLIRRYFAGSARPATARADINEALSELGVQRNDALDDALTEALDKVNGLTVLGADEARQEIKDVGVRLKRFARTGTVEDLLQRKEAYTTTMMALAARLKELKGTKKHAIEVLRDELDRGAAVNRVGRYMGAGSQAIQRQSLDQDARLFVLARMLGAVGDMNSISTQREVLKAVVKTLKDDVLDDDGKRKLAVNLCNAIPDFHCSRHDSGRNMQHKAYKVFRAILTGEKTQVSHLRELSNVEVDFSDRDRALIIRGCAGSLPGQPADKRPNSWLPAEAKKHPIWTHAGAGTVTAVAVTFAVAAVGSAPAGIGIAGGWAAVNATASVLGRYVMTRPPIQESMVERMLETLRVVRRGDPAQSIRTAIDSAPGWEGLLCAARELPQNLRDKIVREFLHEMDTFGIAANYPSGVYAPLRADQLARLQDEINKDVALITDTATASETEARNAAVFMVPAEVSAMLSPVALRDDVARLSAASEAFDAHSLSGAAQECGRALLAEVTKRIGGADAFHDAVTRFRQAKLFRGRAERLSDQGILILLRHLFTMAQDADGNPDRERLVELYAQLNDPDKLSSAELRERLIHIGMDNAAELDAMDTGALRARLAARQQPDDRETLTALLTRLQPSEDQLDRMSSMELTSYAARLAPRLELSHGIQWKQQFLERVNPGARILTEWSGGTASGEGTFNADDFSAAMDLQVSDMYRHPQEICPTEEALRAHVKKLSATTADVPLGELQARLGALSDPRRFDIHELADRVRTLSEARPQSLLRLIRLRHPGDALVEQERELTLAALGGLVESDISEAGDALLDLLGSGMDEFIDRQARALAETLANAAHVRGDELVGRVLTECGLDPALARRAIPAQEPPPLLDEAKRYARAAAVAAVELVVYDTNRSNSVPTDKAPFLGAYEQLYNLLPVLDAPLRMSARSQLCDLNRTRYAESETVREFSSLTDGLTPARLSHLKDLISPSRDSLTATIRMQRLSRLVEEGDALKQAVDKTRQLADIPDDADLPDKIREFVQEARDILRRRIDDADAGREAAISFADLGNPALYLEPTGFGAGFREDEATRLIDTLRQVARLAEQTKAWPEQPPAPLPRTEEEDTQIS